MRRVSRKKKVRMSFVPAMIAIALVVVVVILITKFNSIIKQRERIVAESRQLAAQEEELKARLEELQLANGAGADTAKVETIARGQLDMVYPGEIIFRVSGQ